MSYNNTKQWISLSHFGGLNENSLPRLVCLNTWPPVGRTVWGKVSMYGLVGGGVSLDLRFQKAHVFPVNSLCSCLWIRMSALSCYSGAMPVFCCAPSPDGGQL